MITLVALHLVPLPAQVWHSLPGRDIIVDIDRLTGNPDLWRPLSMAPRLTRNALWSLAVPSAVLLLAVQLEPEQLRKILFAVGLMGIASGILAVLQLAGDPRGSLYFYRITNNGSAVGLFANRNHQAFLLAASIPLLGLSFRGRTSPSERRLSAWPLILAAIAFLFPLILITGSRAGLVMATVASLTWVVGIYLLNASSSTNPAMKRSMWPHAITAVLILALLAVTILSGRDVAFERLLDDSLSGDLRTKILPVVLSMVRMYLPVGSGIGTFVPVYKIYEPDSLLSPYYPNHVHNDWLELLVTGGLPAAFLLGAVFLWLLRKGCAVAVTKRSPQTRPAQASLIIMLLCGMGSLSDYPLRVPSLTAVAMLCLVCLSGTCAARLASDERGI